jgi:hypothetical protein
MTDNVSGAKLPPMTKMLAVELPDVGPVVFSNNLHVTSDGASVYLSFFQVCPPVLMGTEEQQRQQLDQIASVKAQSVVRIAMPVNAFREVVRQAQEMMVRMEGGSPQ